MDTITLNPPRPRRRRYSREFKAQIVAACKQTGTSVAAIARRHDINDNIVHRWLREAEIDAPNLWHTTPSSTPTPLASTPSDTFVPVQISSPSPVCIHLEIARHDLTLRVDWPVAQAQACLHTLLALLR